MRPLNFTWLRDTDKQSPLLIYFDYGWSLSLNNQCSARWGPWDTLCNVKNKDVWYGVQFSWKQVYSSFAHPFCWLMVVAPVIPSRCAWLCRALMSHWGYKTYTQHDPSDPCWISGRCYVMIILSVLLVLYVKNSTVTNWFHSRRCFLRP